MSPAKHKPKKVYAALAILAGVVLFYFEFRRLREHSLIEEWFWLLVALLLIALGLAELFLKPPKP